MIKRVRNKFFENQKVHLVGREQFVVFFERCGLESFGGFVSNECGKLKDVLSEKSCRN